MNPDPSNLGAILAGAFIGWAAAGREKPQGVRLADVFVLGPLMVYVAATAARPTEGRVGLFPGDRASWEPATAALVAAGAATITYNGRNYLRLRGRAEPTSYMGPG
jgi:hypothetical protein